MRIYNSCQEMADETYREIWKRGQTIWDKTVQGRIVTDAGYEQKEIVFYNFRVDNFDDIKLMLDKARQQFAKEHLKFEVAEAWLKDMLSNDSMHENWWDMTEYTKQYFSKFCDEGNGRAAYSYGERIMPQLKSTIYRLKDNLYSRGAVITMDRMFDAERIGRRRPCTNTYHFFARPTLHGDKLNLVVNMRSADAINFFLLDFTKSYLFLKTMVETLNQLKVNVSLGFVIMSINSLHVYKKDIPQEYTW